MEPRPLPASRDRIVRAESKKEAGAAFLKANQQKPDVVTLPSGLQYRVVKQGHGRVPSDTDMVTFRYRGALVDAGLELVDAGDQREGGRGAVGVHLRADQGEVGVLLGDLVDAALGRRQGAEGTLGRVEDPFAAEVGLGRRPAEGGESQAEEQGGERNGLPDTGHGTLRPPSSTVARDSSMGRGTGAAKKRGAAWTAVCCGICTIGLRSKSA